MSLKKLDFFVSSNIKIQTILKKAIKANRALAQLNGTVKIIANK